MANQTEITVLSIAEGIAGQYGAYVVDVEYKKEGRDWVLRIALDKEGGIGIDDCENVSRALSDVLDEKDPIKEPYCLEVTSPGVDRKLKKEREFLYYIGREVEVKLYKATDGKKEFRGILNGYENKTAQIETDGKIIPVNLSEAVYIRLAFDF